MPTLLGNEPSPLAGGRPPGIDETPLRLSVYGAIGANGDLEAEWRKVARDTGVPLQSVRALPEEAKRQAVMQTTDFAGMLQKYPATAALLADQDKARIALDDKDTLTKIEETVGGMARYVVGAAPGGGLPGMVGRAPQALAAGFPALGAQMYGYAAAPFGVADQALQGLSDLAAKVVPGGPARQILDTPGPERALLRLSKSSDDVSKAWQPDMAGLAWWEKDILSGVTSTAQTLPNLAIALAGAPQAIYLGLMGLAAGGGSYAKDREAGKSPATAAVHLATDMTAEIAGEKILGVVGFLRDVKSGMGWGKVLMRDLLRESAGESLTTLAQNFNEWALVNPEKTIGQWMDEQPVALRQTIIATITQTLLHTGAARGIQRALGETDAKRAEAWRATEAAKQIEQLQALGTASKVMARDATTAKAFVAQVADEQGDAPTEFFVDGQKFSEALNQSGLTPEQLQAAAPTAMQELANAASGADVRLPMSEFMALGEKATAPLIDHIRVNDAEAPTRAEATAYVSEHGAELDAAMQRQLEGRSDRQAFQESIGALATKYEAELTQTGRLSPSVSKLQARMLANQYGTLAARAGMTLDEFTQKYQLAVSDRSPGAPGSVIEQAARDQIESPEFKAWLGGSKVVDARGKPLMAYHGTNDDFDAFDIEGANELGSWFTAPVKRYTGGSPEATGYATDAARYAAEDFAATQVDLYGGRDTIYPVYLAIRNPKTFRGYAAFERWSEGSADGRALRARLEAEGYDGVVIRNSKTDGGELRDDWVAFRPEQIKSAIGNRGTFDPNDPNILNQSAPGSDVSHKREKATGRYVGAPDWVGGSPQQLAVLRRNLMKLTREGQKGRFWYEKSARAVLWMVGGDKAQAEKFIGLLAIYSQSTSVPANTTSALRAWYQWKAGLPITAGRFPASQGPKAEAWLNRGEDKGGDEREGGWGGIKTNNFYTDLMEEIDPNKVDTHHSTMDMWVALAFDYGAKILDQGPKYMFAQREIKRIADLLGWRPHQAQAAIWTAIKARVEGSEAARKEHELEQGIAEFTTKVDKETGKTVKTYEIVKGREYDHFRTATRFGLQSGITQGEIDAGDYDFSDALTQRSAQISWEATPGVTSGVLPGIHTAPMTQVVEYLMAIRKALSDADGHDLIDKALGLFTDTGEQGFSGWEGKTTVGVQQRAGVTVDGGTVSGQSRARVNAAADIRGMLLAQDAVAWHFPIYKGPKFAENGIEFAIGRALTEAETDALYKAVSKELGHTFSPPIPTPTGFRLLNFPDAKFSLLGEKDPARIKALQRESAAANVAFTEAVTRAIKSLPIHEEVTDSTRFQTDGELRSATGDDGTYLDRLTAAVHGDVSLRGPGGSDLLRWVEDDLRPRVEAVNADFAKRYGWSGVSRRLDADRRDADGNGRSNLQDRGGAPSYGTATQGAVQVEGWHYSREPRKTLSSAYYGQGLRGFESERLARAADPRIKQRVYFYVNKGTGINPEAGVGAQAHRVELRNLYDTATGKIKGSDLNAFESAVLDAGFDGYLARLDGAQSDQAVLLGRHDVPVEHVGATRPQEARLGPSRPPLAAPTQQEGGDLIAGQPADPEAFRAKAAVVEVAPSFRFEFGRARVAASEAPAANGALAAAGSSVRFDLPAPAIPAPVLAPAEQAQLAELREQHAVLQALQTCMA